MLPHPLFVILLWTFQATSVVARDPSIVNPTTAAAGAAPLPGAHGYTYIGCWNETTGFTGADGARALANGRDSATHTMTTSGCLEYCAQGLDGVTMQYAGLESGRECWCSPHLNVLSEKLNDSRCRYACEGNASDVCGGPSALTLYNLTSNSKTGVAWSLGSGQPAWYGTAAIVTLVIAAVL